MGALIRRTTTMIYRNCTGTQDVQSVGPRRDCETGPGQDEPRVLIMKYVMVPGLPYTFVMLAREDPMIDNEEPRPASSIMKPAAAHLLYKHMSSRRGI
jgi:hypothetical protein